MATLTLAKWDLPAPPDPVENGWRVSLTGNPDDYHACLLASMGMSYSVIARQTGLTFGQISYRLKKANQKRKKSDRICAANYRNGTSRTAQAAISMAAGKCAKVLNLQLRAAQAVIET